MSTLTLLVAQLGEMRERAVEQSRRRARTRAAIKAGGELLAIFSTAKKSAAVAAQETYDDATDALAALKLEMDDKYIQLGAESFVQSGDRSMFTAEQLNSVLNGTADEELLADMYRFGVIAGREYGVVELMSEAGRQLND